jgi:probable HAF family extracellular repeat protein
VPGADTLNGLDPPGAPYGINDSREIVGSYLISDSNQLLGFRRLGFLEVSGSFFSVDDSSAPEFTSAQAISAKQAIVGTYQDSSYVFHGFIEDNKPGSSQPFGQSHDIRGNFRTVDVPGASQDFLCGTIPMGVNGRGEIVGTFFANPDCYSHGFLYSSGTFTEIDVPGATATFPLTINDKGQIVGFYWINENPTQGFLYHDGTYTTISVPGAVRTWPQGINNLGQIVGVFSDPTGAIHCFVQSGKSFTRVDVPGAAGALCFDLNSPGQIVGVFEGSDGVPYGFVGTPSQALEPSR